MPEVIHFRESDSDHQTKRPGSRCQHHPGICRSDALRHPVQTGADHPGLKRMRLAGGGSQHPGWQALSI